MEACVRVNRLAPLYRWRTSRQTIGSMLLADDDVGANSEAVEPRRPRVRQTLRAATRQHERSAHRSACWAWQG